MIAGYPKEALLQRSENQTPALVGLLARECPERRASVGVFVVSVG